MQTAECGHERHFYPRHALHCAQCSTLHGPLQQRFHSRAHKVQTILCVIQYMWGLSGVDHILIHLWLEKYHNQLSQGNCHFTFSVCILLYFKVTVCTVCMNVMFVYVCICMHIQYTLHIYTYIYISLGAQWLSGRAVVL